MEIFELIGKIAVEGTDDAIKAIDDTVKFASQSENKILGYLDKIRIKNIDDTIKFAVQNENKVSDSLEKIGMKINDFWNRNNILDFKKFNLPVDKIEKAFSDLFNKNQFQHDISTDISFNNSESISDTQIDMISALGSIAAEIRKTNAEYDIQARSIVNSKDDVDDCLRHAEKLKNIELSLNLEDTRSIDDKIETALNNLPDSSYIADKIIMMKNAVSEGMPKVLNVQMDSLERIYSGSLEKWRKIGNTASVGITDMVNNIKNGKSFIDSACLLIANSAVKNLTINASSAGQYIMDTLNSGLYSKASQLYSTASSIASTISQTLSSVSIDISTSVSSTRNKLSNYAPKTATGGIVTRAQTRIVGEDGAEAIIPLEKNTEWIDKVASRINSNVGSNNEILEKLTELNENIKNLKVYLDSGTLVGEIAPKMDKKLGSIARRKMRGAVR